MVEVPDSLAGGLADLAIIGAATRARQNGGGHLHPDLATLLRTLATAAASESGSDVGANQHDGHGDAGRAAPPVTWLTTGEAAQRLHVSDRQIRYRAAAGRLTARRSRGGWLIALHREDVHGGDDGTGGGDRAGGT